jgi:hypothetical protein
MEPMDAFIDDDGGYTSLSVALSLLLSLTLAFGAAAAGWMMARSSEVQEVADASALAAEQVVARYSTVAQVSDACVLSMGLTGVLVLGAGLVASAIPGAGTVASAIVDAGTKVLDARRDFAKSAAEGLSGLERALPTLIVLSSYDVVEANESDGISYGGCAIPYPLESASEFDLADDVDPAELVESSERLQKASERAREAKERADAALLAGWEADCGGEPRSLQERAATLAGLDEAENPDYPTPEGWNFGVPLSRSRAYYAARLADETPEGSGIEPQTDSALRERFYAYALGEMRSGHYRELPDGSVDMSLPRLPHNADETRGTKLYTERVWTCTQEPEGLVIHSTASCPGASGPKAGLESLQAIDAGRAHECRVCKLDVGEMGRVAAASTSIDNGYEHYWREVVDAADVYQQATDELADAQREMREIGEEGDSAFEEALEQLKVERPRLCPPGSYGCVAVVRREPGTQVTLGAHERLDRPRRASWRHGGLRRDACPRRGDAGERRPLPLLRRPLRTGRGRGGRERGLFHVGKAARGIWVCLRVGGHYGRRPLGQDRLRPGDEHRLLASRPRVADGARHRLRARGHAAEEAGPGQQRAGALEGRGGRRRGKTHGAGGSRRGDARGGRAVARGPVPG